MADAYEEYAVEGSDIPIWLPKPTGYKAVFLQLDIAGVGVFVDIDNVDEAWQMVNDARTRDLSFVRVREPFFGEDNIVTREALNRVLWIKPEYIDHEQIKANTELQKQQAAAMQAGIVAPPQGFRGRNGRRA